MQHPPTVWPDPIRRTIADTIHASAETSDWSVTALAIEPTHFHLLITPLPSNLDATCKWLTQQITKAIRIVHDHPNPIFAKGKWATIVTQESHWQNATAYINRHPTPSARIDPKNRRWHRRS